MVTVNLLGIPQQQGSKRHVGRGIMIEANKELPRWRRDAILQCQTSQAKYTGPVMVDVTFWFPRPASHYGTGRNAGTVRATAPLVKTSAPDLDKLQRAVGDVLTQSGLLLDDRLIVEWSARKWWTSQVPQAVVTITEVTA